MADFFLNKYYIDITLYSYTEDDEDRVNSDCRVYRKSYRYNDGITLNNETDELQKILDSCIMTKDIETANKLKIGFKEYIPININKILEFFKNQNFDVETQRKSQFMRALGNAMNGFDFENIKLHKKEISNKDFKKFLIDAKVFFEELKLHTKMSTDQETDSKKFFEHLKDFEKFSDDKQIDQFLKQLEKYQFNHYGTYDRSKLVKVYENLSQEFKQNIQPNSLENLYRGADGLAYREAISFTNKSWAAFYGHYAIPFEELEAYEGLIDTNKVVNYITDNDLEYDIGDDEGEIIVIEPKWKPDLEDKLKQYKA